MSLFNYFKRKKAGAETLLPEPGGLLSSILPSSQIEAVNCAVKPLVKKACDEGSSSKRGGYKKFSADEKAAIGKTGQLSEYGVMATIRHYSKIYRDRPLKESTVRGWKNHYNQEIVRMKKAGKEIVARELFDKKRGSPLFLGEEMDKEVHAYIIELRASGCPINTDIAIATGVGIVKHCDSNLLFENSGHISLNQGLGKVPSS